MLCHWEVEKNTIKIILKKLKLWGIGHFCLNLRHSGAEGEVVRLSLESTTFPKFVDILQLNLFYKSAKSILYKFIK